MGTNKLNIVNEAIKTQLKKLDEINYKLVRDEFKLIRSFLSVQDILDKNKFNTTELPDTKGLYLIEAKFENCRKESWNNFVLEWKLFKEKTPTIVNSRLEKNNLDENKCQSLYLGKAEKINKRVNEHFYCQTSDNKSYLKSTSALRLHQFFHTHNVCELVSAMKFKVYYLELNFEDALLYEVEKRLRNSLNCIIGKH